MYHFFLYIRNVHSSFFNPAEYLIILNPERTLQHSIGNYYIFAK